MKIYCVMCDSAYFTMQEAAALAEKNNATYLTQVSNSWTLSSVVPMMTGRLTSDIMYHGLPWDYAYPEMVEKHKQAWNKDIIQDEMLKRDWDMHYHNNTCLYTLLYGDPKIKQTSITCPETEIEKEGIWGKDDTIRLMFGTDEKSIEFTNKEFDYIKKFQQEKPTKNKLYLITYQHLHMAIGTGQEPHHKIDLKKANQKVFDLINAWDFNEPDSLFIFFADHGNFRVVDRFMSPPHSWLTWALVKDNTQNKQINKKLVSIRDFYTLFAEKVGLDYDKKYREDIEDIFSEQNRDRVYFGEDGRSVVNPDHSTTASAIKAIEWCENGYPRKFLQVAYHKPFNQFVMFLYDALTEEISIREEVDADLKRKLIKRFTWIKPWVVRE